jgi:CRISPR-associated protein Cmr1
MRKNSARRTVAVGKIELSDPPKHRIEETLEFITPMFGGGVRLDGAAPHHKAADEVTPVRGASVRGQLRTWWRRACAAGLDLETMRAREQILWGWASTKDRPAKGLVAIAVSAEGLTKESVAVYETGNPKKPIDGFGAAIAYGAFPLQPSQGAAHQAPGTLTRWKGKFSISLEMHPLGGYRDVAERAWGAPADLEQELWKEVQWAWLAFVTFGGLGGRTRRGFGAIRVVGGGAKTLEYVTKELRWGDRMAKLKACPQHAEKAQKDALAKLQSFRQGRNVGRNPGQQPNRPGRSRWPEPDEIRRLTKEADPSHRQPITSVRKFPRAAFGMPIIFHFQSRNDPGDTSLQPAARERLASPIILRPVLDPDASVHAVALRVPGDKGLEGILGNLQLRRQQQTHERLGGLLTENEQKELGPLCMNANGVQSGVDAVLIPFFNYFKS